MNIKIELITAPGCDKCLHAQQQLYDIAVCIFGKDHLDWREINVLKEFEYAVTLGVLSMPALAINGELAFSSLPTPEQFRVRLESLFHAP